MYLMFTKNIVISKYNINVKCLLINDWEILYGTYVIFSLNSHLKDCPPKYKLIWNTPNRKRNASVRDNQFKIINNSKINNSNDE